MTRSRVVFAGTLAFFALAPTAVAAAGPPTSLRTTNAPPAAAAAGEAFTLTGRVRNVSQRAVRPRVSVSLRTKRASKDGRIVVPVRQPAEHDDGEGRSVDVRGCL